MGVGAKEPWLFLRGGRQISLEFSCKKEYDNHMKAKRKTIFTITSILLFFFSLAVVFFFRNWLLVNPFQPFELSEVITAYQDQEGNL